MYPFKKTTTKLYYEVTPEVEVFLKWLKVSGVSEKRGEFGVYVNNNRYPITTDAYLEIELNDSHMDLSDVLRAYFRRQWAPFSYRDPGWETLNQEKREAGLHA